jgi:hypothetical protein
VPSARFGATRRSWKSPRGSGALDRALTVAAVAYYAAVIVFTILLRSGDLNASGIDSSADELADGQVLRLLTSVIAVEGPLAVPQIALGRSWPRSSSGGREPLCGGSRRWWDTWDRP